MILFSFRIELFQYKVMLVARQEMVTSFITLKGANLCLPGYEPDPEEDWTPFHARVSFKISKTRTFNIKISFSFSY